MNPETPNPWLSRVVSYLALAFASLTLNPIHHASSSSAPHDVDPEHQSPVSTLQGGSDTGMPPQCPESESVEANNDELAVVSNFIPSASCSSSAPAIPYGEEDTLSSSPLFRHSQINSISPTRVSFSSKDPSPSSPTKRSHDPNSPNINSQNLHSAEPERWEHVIEIIDEQPAETTSRRDPNSLHVMEIIDEQDLGKHILGLAIPMGVALIFSTRKLAKTTEMRVVVIALCFAIDALWVGLLLRKTYPKTCTVILMLGIASMMLSFYACVGCFLPLHLKWIPVLCWLVSLIPFAMGGWAYFGRKKVTHTERG